MCVREREKVVGDVHKHTGEVFFHLMKISRIVSTIIGLNTHNLDILLKIGFTLNSKL